MIKFHGKKSVLKGQINQTKKLLHAISSDHGYDILEINYIFVDDEALLKINRESLKHDYYTDIITFDYTVGESIEAEIYISIDRVKENGLKFKETFHVELLRVIIHGLLHVVGYKDKTKNEKIKMRNKENHYLGEYLNRFHVEQ